MGFNGKIWNGGDFMGFDLKNLELCGTSWDSIEKLDRSMREFMGFDGKIWNCGDFMEFDEKNLEL